MTLRLPKLAATSNKSQLVSNSKSLPEASEEFINAIKIGFIVYPSVQLIRHVYEQQHDAVRLADAKLQQLERLKQSQADEADENDEDVSLSPRLYDLHTIDYLNMSAKRIIEVGDLCFCERLRILNLSNNYLIDIEPLRICTNLSRLDLSSNQITSLPDQSFWSSMIRLKLLYMHNNLISRMENLRYISACPGLEILTMYDTPLSLKNNYRHHFVNSIFSLKAFDHFIVSDEEIIEEARFNNIFAARTRPFRINLTLAPTPGNCLRDELKATHELTARINTILAHYSPVLIIQKNVRGYLVRKRLRAVRKQRLSLAALRIQRWWRKLKKLKYVRAPTINAIANREKIDQLSKNKKPKTRKEVAGSRRNSKELTMASHARRNIIIDLNKLEYNFQSGFQQSALNSRSNLPQIISKSSMDQPPARSNSIGTMLSSHALAGHQLGPGVGTGSGLEKPPSHQSVHSTKDDDYAYDSNYLMRLYKESSGDRDKLARINEVLTMLGTRCHHDKDATSRAVRLERLRALADAAGDDEPVEDAYRLSVLNVEKSRMRPRDEMAIDTFKEKFVSSKAIRKMKHETHKLIEDLDVPPVVRKETFLTNDQRFFQKVYGNMSLGALRAVDKAYEERAQNDTREEKKKRMGQMRDFNKYWHQQVQFHREDHVNQAKASETSDRQRLAKLKRAREIQAMQTRQAEQDARERYKSLHGSRKRDVHLAVDLSKQHLSVSKALQSHEYQTNRLTSLKENHELVSKQRHAGDVQKQLVKRYLEQRNLLRVLQSASERRIIEVRVRDDRALNDDEAKKRVSELRSRETRSGATLVKATKKLSLATTAAEEPPRLPVEAAVKA